MSSRSTLYMYIKDQFFFFSTWVSCTYHKKRFHNLHCANLQCANFFQLVGRVKKKMIIKIIVVALF